MAEYRLEFTADTNAAGRNIKLLEKAIKGITQEFKEAEIGSEEFLQSAAQISTLKKEVNDARNAVVNLDRAYRDLSRAVEAGNRAFGGAVQAAQRYNNSVQKLEEERYAKQDQLRDKNYQAELDDWDRRLNAAVAASSKIAARQRAIMEFRAGMGAAGAIPTIASPIRGGAAFPGSPDYLQPQSLAFFEKKLQDLRNEARLISPDTKTWKELTQEILRVEKSVERINRKQRLGPSLRDRAGAAGGAFLYGGGLGGGLGSALGGVGGGLAGGVAGAFTGAAIGQLVDNLGKVAAATASYTAQIDRQRIALRNLVADNQQYQQSLQFIDKTSRDLAIPQEQVNQGFTRIAASVIGAGGNVQDAQLAFDGIAAGIRGTGGSLEDMQGALLATSQVFSKGKVAAEELRGQIGERLPGAFTLFAEAIGKTPQELDKMLEQGQVGLNEFMLFVQALSAKYGQTALQIAGSTQAAGDRLATAMARMREAVGRELQPIGAEFQTIFATFVDEHTPNFVTAAGVIADTAGMLAKALQGLQDNFAQIGIAIGAIAVTIAAAKLPAIIASITAALAGLKVTLLGLATVASVAAPWVALAAGLAAIGIAAYDAHKETTKFDEIARDTSSTTDQLSAAIAEAKEELAAAEQKSRNTGDSITALGQSGFAAQAEIKRLREQLAALEGRYTAIIEIQQIFSGAQGVPQGYKLINGKLAYEVPGMGFVDAQTSKAIAPQGSITQFPGGTGGRGGGGGKAGKKGRESRVPELTEELNLAKQLLALDQQIAAEQLAGNQFMVIHLNSLKEQLRVQSEIAKVRMQQNVPAAEKQLQIEKLLIDAETGRLQANLQIQQEIQAELKQVEDAMVNIATTAKQELEDRQEYENLLKTGMAPAIAQITVEVTRQFAIEVARLKALETQISAQITILETQREQTKDAQKRLEIEERLAVLRGDLAKTQQGIAGAPALVGETIESRTQKQRLEEQPKSGMGFLTEASEATQKELTKLTNWGFQAVEGAKAIGSAFGQAFKDIASGSVSAQEALANMMQSIADHFLDMAAQIIAQQITMMIYGMILKALGVMGGAASGLSGTGALTPGAGATASLPTSYAGVTGGTAGLGSLGTSGGFGSFSMFGFANGGVVTGPTLGLIGEGKYNEAIVPLPDGRSIPVQMQGDSVREKMNNSSAAPPSSPILSMTFESTTIGGVEYVSRDQLEQAMAETRRAASRDGAQRGMTMTLDRIQNSSSTRRRIGM